MGAVPQRFRQRQGRQETGYLAPAPDAYGAPSEDAPALYAAPEEPVADASELDNAYLAPEASDVDTAYLAPSASDEAAVEADAPLDSYGAEEELSGYEELDTAASEAEGEEADPLKMLMNAVPGVPGEDYPIFSEAPETAFSCDGQVDGGYYADEEAQCQVFHICTADGAGGLAKYSFLCPNGTIFNQNYFICDWWFNFDCAEAEGLSPSMTRLLPNELKLTELLLMPLLLMLPHLMLLLIMLLQLNQLLTMQLLLNMVKLALPDRDRSLAGMVEEAKSRFPLLLFLDVLYF